MQSIYTKYLPATNVRGSRVKAWQSGGKMSLTRSWDNGADTDMNHMLVAKELAEKLGWHGTWVEGSGPKGFGNVYVCVNGDSFTVEK